MCSDPQTKDNREFACRVCNECIATRRAELVARGVMELTQHKFAIAIALTYSDETEFTRDGAAMFRYSDVRHWLRALRHAVQRVDKTARIRFICAGEQGDRYNRVHWHTIIYSDVDPVLIGQKVRMWNGKKTITIDRERLMTTPGKEVRVNWELWPHGYVTFQDADERAISYALSYALKDQFTSEKSKSTKRLANSETFATGMVRRSTRPPLGVAFVHRLFEKYFEEKRVPVSLNFKVPGLSGYYHPSGSFRRLILGALHALNKRILWATGRNSPQWSSLVASLPDHLATDRELLEHGPQQDEQQEQWGVKGSDYTDGTSSILLGGRERARASYLASVQRECGRVEPCYKCLIQETQERLAARGLETYIEGDWQSGDIKLRHTADGRQYTGSSFVGKLNPDCSQAGSRDRKDAFPASSRAIDRG